MGLLKILGLAALLSFLPTQGDLTFDSVENNKHLMGYTLFDINNDGRNDVLMGIYDINNNGKPDHYAMYKILESKNDSTYTHKYAFSLGISNNEDGTLNGIWVDTDDNNTLDKIFKPKQKYKEGERDI